MDKGNIIEALIANFILKDRRDRSRLELTNSKKRHKIIDRLNHNWDSIFDLRKFTPIAERIENLEQLKRIIPIKSKSRVYVISNNPEIDDNILTFQKAIEGAFTFGLGSIIYDFENEFIYFEGEQDFGPPDRYIGTNN